MGIRLSGVAEQEYTRSYGKSQTGYGIDGNFTERTADFANVRGTFETNTVAGEIKQHIEEKSRLADELIHRLQKIR